METPALVSRLSLIENVCLICLFLNKPATTAIQHSLFFYSSCPSNKVLARWEKKYSKNDRLEYANRQAMSSSQIM